MSSDIVIKIHIYLFEVNEMYLIIPQTSHIWRHSFHTT